jgi:thiamine transport system permease protein
LEDAASTLGASGFTVFRTVTFPLVKEGLISGSILAFARSLGETGGTVIVAGLFQTAPLLILTYRQELNLPAAAFLSGILIIICLALLAFVKIFTRKGKFPMKKVFPHFEQSISQPVFRKLRNGLSGGVFLAFIFLPAIYIVVYVIQSGSSLGSILYGADIKYAYLWTSLMDSFLIAGITVLIVLITGVPMAFIIVNRKWGKFNAIIDTLVDIPLAIPSAALGFATFLFWGPPGLGWFSPGFWLIVWVHVAFTFPYMVRPVISIIQKSNKGLEDASRTLGASNFTTFRRITLPVIKYGILSGAIMSFARSLGETGATLVVMGNIRTIPVLIVDWFQEGGTAAITAAAFAAVIIIAFSFVLIFSLRYFSNPRREMHA